MAIRVALIVGDNPSLYIHISNLFQQHGCQCKVALDGSLPGDRLLALKPDFILLDLPLRSLPALQSIKQIRETLQELRTRTMIIAPNALLHRSDFQFANVHLAKPFSTQEAETAVLKLLNINRGSESAAIRSDNHLRL
jgi:DNA-binding response OmpR family regulator